QGYEIWVSFVGVDSAALAVARVAERVRRGGHPVPEAKIRARYVRQAPLAAAAVRAADRGFVVDNTTLARPLRDVLVFERGRVTFAAADVPAWARRAFAPDLQR